MRCVAICVAKEYRLYGLSNLFRKQGNVTKLYEKVLHVTDADLSYHVFIFSYGCVVIWGLKRLQEQEMLMKIEPFAIDPLPASIYERFLFRHDGRTHIIAYGKFGVSTIILESEDPLIKLAFSFGLAQSVKLRCQESSVERVINQSMYLPEELHRRGKIALSNRAISRRVGDIFTVRSFISLSSVYFEPEYLLGHFEVTQYYSMSREFLHISQRVSILNQKLDALHGLFEMLTSQLQYRLGTILMLVASALVMVQVLIGALQLIK